MHEIARGWNTDIARYLQSKGVPIDQADGYGRTPLFVAVAAENMTMLKWLLDQGGTIYFLFRYFLQYRLYSGRFSILFNCMLL